MNDAAWGWSMSPTLHLAVGIITWGRSIVAGFRGMIPVPMAVSGMVGESSHVPIVPGTEIIGGGGCGECTGFLGPVQLVPIHIPENGGHAGQLCGHESDHDENEPEPVVIGEQWGVEGVSGTELRSNFRLEHGQVNNQSN